MLKTKSIYDSINKEDGLRILCTRFIPRGTRKTRYDVWMANLGPSEKILKDYQNERISWNEFKLKYKRELLEGYEEEKFNHTRKNKGQKFTLRLLKKISRCQYVTLMCHCEDSEPHCHIRILKELVKGVKI